MYEDVLAQVPLFSSLDKRELQALASSCRERDYPAGAALMRQGDTGVGLFIITNGRVNVTQDTPDGTTRELGVFGRGDVLGEMSLLDDQARTATVTASDPTSALVIPVWDFRAVLREAPEISIKLLSVLSQRLRAAEAQKNPAAHG
ncbi:MAG: cyclic nucleotide-binding domain-containing protein [Ktedonobacterales bacterium]